MKAKHSLNPTHFAASLALAASLVPSVIYADQVWDGGGGDPGNWNTAANWGDDALPNFASEVTFTGTTQTETFNDLAADTIIGGIRFIKTSDTGVFTLSGNRITLGGDITSSPNTQGLTPQLISLDMILNGNRSIQAFGGYDVSISGVISDDGSARNLSKTGSGNLFLSGANTFTGSFSVGQGTAYINSIANSGVASAIGAGSVLNLGTGSSTSTLVYTGGEATTDRTVNLDSSTQTATIQNDGSGALSFAGPITNSGTSKILTLAGTHTATANEISGTISGGDLTVKLDGAGTWKLSGDNSYTGATTLSNGATLAGVGTHAFGSTTGIAMVPGTVLSLLGDTSTEFRRADNDALYAVTSNSDNITINVDQATGAGTGAKTMTIGDFSTTSSTGTFDFNFTGANNTSLSIGAMIGQRSSSFIINNTISGGGELTIASYSSHMDNGSDSTVIFDGTGNTTVTGAIAEGGAKTLGLTQTGTGTLTLMGESSYTGVTTISLGAGTLEGIGTHAFGSTSEISIYSGTTLSLLGDSSTEFRRADTDALYEVSSTSSNVTMNVDQTTGAGTGAKTMSIGDFSTTSGVASFAFNVTGANNTSLSLGEMTGAKNASTVTLNNSISGGGSFTVASYTSHATAPAGTVVFDGTGDTQVTGAIAAGSGNILSLDKSGTGKLTLLGASTYTGDTNVNEGSLFVNGSLTADSALTISSGAALGGSGTVNGTVLLQSGATLTPGNSPGELTLGATTLEGGSNYNWQVVDAGAAAGVGYDTITLTSGSALTLNNTSGSPFSINLWSLSSTDSDVNGDATNFLGTSDYIWTLISTDQTIVGFSEDKFAINVGANNGTAGFTNALAGGSFSVELSGDSTDLVLRYEAVPEPSASMLIAGVGAFMLTMMRRKRRA